MSLFNEIMVSLYIYGLIMLSDFLPSLGKDKDSLAFVLLSIINFTIGVNCL